MTLLQMRPIRNYWKIQVDVIGGDNQNAWRCWCKKKNGLFCYKSSRNASPLGLPCSPGRLLTSTVHRLIPGNVNFCSTRRSLYCQVIFTFPVILGRLKRLQKTIAKLIHVPYCQMLKWNKAEQQPEDVTYRSSYFPAGISLEEELGLKILYP